VKGAVQLDSGELAGYLYMQNRPAGYTVGEQLADPVGSEDSGQPLNLRSLLDGHTFFLLDVCAGWCPACRDAQPQGPIAIAQLGAEGIALRIVPLLLEGSQRVPTTQGDAFAWRSLYQLPGPVLHDSGAFETPFWNAGSFVLGVNQPGFPTYLLVGPDGTILNRHIVAMQADEIVALVESFGPPPPPNELRVSDVSVSEGAGAAVVTVSRSRTDVATSVSYSTLAGTAGGLDFGSTSGVLTFAAGQPAATISVPILEDTIDEPSESFTVVLSSPSGKGATIADGVGVVTITDNDDPSVLSIDTGVRVVEGTGGKTTVPISLHLDKPSGFSIVVKYSIAAGTASASDIVVESGSLAFEKGMTSATIFATVIADALPESKETFLVNLTSASNAKVPVNQSVVTIVDDDGDTIPPVVSPKGDVVEIKMALNATVVVSFTNPPASDNKSGSLSTICSPPSGSLFGYGTTGIGCTAEDKAGNIGFGKFSVVVRTPSVPGAVFDAANPSGPPLTQAFRGQQVLVRVNAGAFAPRARVRLAFVAADGARYDLDKAAAEGDGSLSVRTVIPIPAALGPGHMVAESAAAGGDYDRAWALEVLPRP
jgi:hypothetical protein